MTLPSQRDHIAGVIAALEDTGQPVGDAERPADRSIPYCVVYDLSGAAYDGPISDPDADVELPVQVTCVGETAEQARWMADAAASALQAVAVTGRRVQRVLPIGGPGTARRDDETVEKLFYVTPQWRLFTTPE